jgi:hypothetical protein
MFMPVSKPSSFLLALAGAALLSACHSKPDKSEDQRTAEGEVLSSTVSDAMLPPEAPKSTPPAEPKKDVGDRATEDATSDAADIRDAMNALSADKSADQPADAAKAPAAPQ